MSVLLTVVDAGSLAAAARRLHAPLATVSRKVSDLEKHLGVRLVLRTRRGLAVTEEGRLCCKNPVVLKTTALFPAPPDFLQQSPMRRTRGHLQQR